MVFWIGKLLRKRDYPANHITRETNACMQQLSTRLTLHRENVYCSSQFHQCAH